MRMVVPRLNININKPKGPSDVEQDKDIILETVIKFLQTVLTGKTDYSQPQS